MTTKTLASNTLRFSKILIATALLALGFSLESTQAAQLTNQQAKDAANQILSYSASQQYNAAYTVSRDVTANTGAEYAAFNARLIAKNISKGKQVALFASIINGVSNSYPNQMAAIATQIILLNDNTRDHANQILSQISMSADTASQIAVGINTGMRKDDDMLKRAGNLTFTILWNINSSSNGTAADRANEMAIAAGNLAANLLTPDRHGKVSKANKKAFDQITNVLAAFAKTAPTGSLTREQFVNNIVGIYASTLKTSVTSGSSATSTATLNRARTVLTGQLSSSSSTVNQVIQDVINDPNGSYTPVGPVVPPETPH